MTSLPPSEATQLLRRIAAGDEAATAELFPVVYEDLRRLAAAYLGRERKGHTLQPTALVHEAFLRLVSAEELGVVDRAHFFRIAARAMRQLLVDHARRRKAQKRGGGAVLQTQSLVEEAAGPGREATVLEVHDALEALAELDPRKAQLVEMRFFAGMTIAEAAAALGIGHATAERDWAFARSWLADRLQGGGEA